MTDMEQWTTAFDFPPFSHITSGCRHRYTRHRRQTCQAERRLRGWCPCAVCRRYFLDLTTAALRSCLVLGVFLSIVHGLFINNPMWPSGKLIFECQNLPKPCHFCKKKCQKLSLSPQKLPLPSFLVSFLAGFFFFFTIFYKQIAIFRRVRIPSRSERKDNCDIFFRFKGFMFKVSSNIVRYWISY